MKNSVFSIHFSTHVMQPGEECFEDVLLWSSLQQRRWLERAAYLQLVRARG